jgi:SAM-dependent methyltransferase
MTEREDYFLGHRRAEQERLQQQAEQLRPEAERLFDDIGLAAGARVLEIGCGPRGCLDLLAERVGPSGSVTAIERNEEAAGLAREFVAGRGLRNVEIHCGDARSTGLPRASFDLVTARLVLVNVPHSEEIVAEAVALARPGGAVAFHEVDWAAMICDPPLSAWDTFVKLFVSQSIKGGSDPFVGRKLPRLLRSAGLVDIRVHPIMHVHPPTDPRRNIFVTFADNLRERVLAQNVMPEAAFTDMREALRRHIENPDALVVHGPYFQAWGRKPA